MIARKANARTVLIVSANPERISVWEKLFQQKNCRVVNEATPQAAFQTALTLSPALIVLNLDLSPSAKLELCRKLRAATQGVLLLLAPSEEDPYMFEYSGAGVDEQISTSISPVALVIKSMAWLVKREWIALV
ncbi:MAG: response regulator transcription factor [Anaerolineales bacterium]|nr:response regulator transcription factor [Anaerolineales bacterium]